MRAFVVLISSFLVAAPAFAQSSMGSVSGSAAELSTESEAPERTGAASERNADGERRICRRIEADSSSRMATRRVCRTAAEWRESQRAR